LAEIGQRITRHRLDLNLSQSALAKQAGIGLRTLQRLESGEAATHLTGFIRICRALGLLGRFEQLIPDAIPSPMAQLKLQGKQRQRASRSQPDALREEAVEWKWGDDT